MTMYAGDQEELTLAPSEVGLQDAKDGPNPSIEDPQMAAEDNSAIRETLHVRQDSLRKEVSF